MIESLNQNVAYFAQSRGTGEAIPGIRWVPEPITSMQKLPNGRTSGFAKFFGLPFLSNVISDLLTKVWPLAKSSSYGGSEMTHQWCQNNFVTVQNLPKDIAINCGSIWLRVLTKMWPILHNLEVLGKLYQASDGFQNQSHPCKSCPMVEPAV